MASARAPVRLLAVGAVALLAAGAGPGRAAEAPAAAGLVLGQSVEERVAPGRWGPYEAGAGLVVGDQIRVRTEVFNSGDEVADVTLRLVLPEVPVDAPRLWRRWGGITLAGCVWASAGPGADTIALECRRRMGAGNRAAFLLPIEAHAPGELQLLTTAHGPDGTGEARAWHTRITCSVNGTPGDDVLAGGDGGDSICGGAGDDTLVAAGPGDRFFGGAGDDTFVAGAHSSEFVGGDGSDTATLAQAAGPQTICLGPHGAASAQGSGTTVIAYGTERYVGSPFADRIWGGPAADDVRGGRGSDSIAGGGGRDLIDAGRGHDRLRTRDGAADVVVGGSGRDRAFADAADAVTSADRVEARWHVPNVCRG